MRRVKQTLIDFVIWVVLAPVFVVIGLLLIVVEWMERRQ